MPRIVKLFVAVTVALSFVTATCNANLEIQSSGPVFVLEQEKYYPELNLITVGDLTGDGKLEVVVATGDGVEVLDDTLQPLASFTFPSSPTALATGNIDGYPALIVGSSAAGAAYYLRLQQGRLVQVSRTGYLWSSVSFICVANLTGLYGDDLLIVTEDARLLLFTWDGKGFRSVTETSLPFQPEFMAVGDLGHTAQAEVVLAKGNHLQVLTYDDGSFHGIWDNYTWGNINHVSILPVEKTPQLVIGTKEKIIQSYRYKDQRFQLENHYFGEHLSLTGFSPCNLGLGHFTIVGYSDDRNPVLMKASGKNLLPLWTNRNTDSTIRNVLVAGTDTLVTSTDNLVQLWKRRPVNYHTIFLNAEPYTARFPALIAYDTIYISLPDMGDLVGIDYSYIQPGKIAKIPYWHHFLTLYEGVWQVFLGQESIALDGPVITYNNQTYVPLSCLTKVFGLTAVWDHSRRILWIEKATFE
ncbi:MAG: stalk domain-containing protein [Limnochordia bacterium]|jgi:hypothetical protein